MSIFAGNKYFFIVSAQENITFEIAFEAPQTHYTEVAMHISNIEGDIIDVKMPVWAPGSYLIREFPKNVEDFRAQADGQPLKIEKQNKNTWRIYNGKQRVITIRYRVYAFEASVRTSFIDASHAFLSPPGIFMYVEDKIHVPVRVIIKPHAGWSTISTGLERVVDGDNTFYAPNFDILFDCPIEVGNQDLFTFEAAGVHHEVAMVGGGNYNKDRLKRDITSIVETQTKIYGENPNERYVFIVHHYQSGGGGLEHLNSTVLGASRFGYDTERVYTGFLGLVAHEYFHLWNVKRLRPLPLGPFNYDAENYTPNLWIAEGFTAYYDNLTLRRCDLYSVDAYLRVLADDINLVENRPGNRVQSLTQSSFDAWIKHYRPDENSNNTTVTYYNKGSLIALILDLKLLEATYGAKRLDDLMRAMYDTYYKDKNRGFTRQEFETMATDIAGTSLADVFDNVDAAAPITYNTYLHFAGLELVDQMTTNTVPTLGLKVAERDGKMIVTAIDRGSGAWGAGVNVRDELIAINDFRVDPTGSDMERILSTGHVGDEVRVLVSRDGIIRTLNVKLSKDPRKRFIIQSVKDPTERQQRIRKVWLSA